MATVFLGLGSNLGDRFANLRAAVAALGGMARVEALSRVYETAPLYVLDQPAFLNMAARVETGLAPRDLLAGLKGVEAELGREKTIRFGPRLIDLDILIYGGLVLDESDLTIPHPRLPERRFALAPLADIAARVVHPLAGRTVEEMLDALPRDDDVVVVAEGLE
ncbi:2-amino-4-hydroxy-6-hydroxymethyldihydropteridine diphosphokinase [Magnetospirillum sp. UT-4]|uniref:2-amino-4-hydroxy-6- hydroxymethyldihydropteridine diphosphokinase n=1 Tax=Magnetospirillum sp. UT-4 TaxID=2681467 RepID=UPI001386294C|nr:2-amino-4-hydroxy-6-hydroxymethyldihydropteridine diphosphokinase [Magnetospirillum sp. UT-4]CAA7611308.1 2-amino-4-hydroxy-6-hydroxymethyldihydropteridinepyrophosphokinase [Magnetospirillum sp. UT-4]